MAAVTVEGKVVEEEKVDLEIPQEKVDVKKVGAEEPESAGGCDVCLHLLLPEDRVLDEEKEHYPRAFSDGEIAYES